MVRGDPTEESDSDWDSLSVQAVPPPPPLPTDSVSRQPLQKNTPVNPMRSQVAAGPFTFIVSDRQQQQSPVLSARSIAHQTGPTIVKKDPPETVDEKQLPEADVEEVEFQEEEEPVVSVQQRHPGLIHQINERRWSTPTATFCQQRTPMQPKRDAEIDVISQSSSTGFDNIAFEANSGKGYSPSPVRVLGTDSFQPFQSENNKNIPVSSPPHPQSPLPVAEETIEIFRYDKANIEFNQTVTEKRGLRWAHKWNESLSEFSNRFWYEVTAVLGLPLVLIVALLVQLLRFLTGSLLRPLLIGLLLGVSDGLFKPLLAATHNALIAPMASFFYNLGTAVKLVAEPLVGVLQLALEPVGRLLRSCRLVEIHHHPLRHI